MPAGQDPVHIRPTKVAGVQTSPVIGDGDGVHIKAHIQPLLGVLFLAGGEVSAPNLQGLHHLTDLGAAQILILYPRDVEFLYLSAEAISADKEL